MDLSYFLTYMDGVDLGGGITISFCVKFDTRQPLGGCMGSCPMHRTETATSSIIARKDDIAFS